MRYFKEDYAVSHAINFSPLESFTYMLIFSKIFLARYYFLFSARRESPFQIINSYRVYLDIRKYSLWYLALQWIVERDGADISLTIWIIT